MADIPKPKADGGTAGPNSKAVIAGVCVVAVIAGVILYATGVIGPKKEDTGLKYATKGTMVLDAPNGIYDEIPANAIALEFRNDAYSKDGQTFSCYLGNSALNSYDMFVALYTTTEMNDEDLIYLSDLVPPGSGFEEITLDRPLEEGDHRLTVAFTQVEDAATNTAHAQTLFTMDFHVVPD